MAARSLSAFVKPASSAVSYAFSGTVILRRGYVATQEGALLGGYGKGRATGAMMGKHEERATGKESEAASAWTPDPITGYYRPANRGEEIDPAELREMLLKHRTKPF